MYVIIRWPSIPLAYEHHTLIYSATPHENHRSIDNTMLTTPPGPMGIISIPPIKLYFAAITPGWKSVVFCMYILRALISNEST